MQPKHGAPSTLAISIGFFTNSAISMGFFTTTLYVHLPLYSILSRDIRSRFSKLLTNLEPSLLSRENTLQSSVWNIPASPVRKIVSKTCSIKLLLVLIGSFVEVTISDAKRLPFHYPVLI